MGKKPSNPERLRTNESNDMSKKSSMRARRNKDSESVSRPSKGIIKKPPLPLHQKSNGKQRISTKKFLAWATENFSDRERDQVAHPGESERRRLDFRDPSYATRFDMRESKYRLPALIHTGAADAPEGPCSSCAKGSGPFNSCRVPADETVLKLTKGACTSCYWGNTQSRCSFHKTSKYYDQSKPNEKRSEETSSSDISEVNNHGYEENVNDANQPLNTNGGGDDTLLFIPDDSAISRLSSPRLMPSVLPQPAWMAEYNRSISTSDPEALQKHTETLMQVIRANERRAIALELMQASKRARQDYPNVHELAKHENSPESHPASLALSPSISSRRQSLPSTQSWPAPVMETDIFRRADDGEQEQLQPKKKKKEQKEKTHRTFAGFVLTDSEASDE